MQETMRWRQPNFKKKPQGTTVHVVGLDDLRHLKQNAGRPKDLDDLDKLDEIARATLGTDDQDA